MHDDNYAFDRFERSVRLIRQAFASIKREDRVIARTRLIRIARHIEDAAFLVFDAPKKADKSPRCTLCGKYK